MNISFVILHYCQVAVTEDCIDSLLNLKGNMQIVIVDNASPDGSGKLLDEKFKNHPFVHVILNDKNLGFASANNIGYLFAKKNLGADSIIVMNNDTLIRDENFLDKVATSELLKEYHIIAPDIINKRGEHQNPFAAYPLTYKEAVRNLKKIKLLRLIYSIPLVGNIKASLRVSRKNVRTKEGVPEEMIVPHGAAIIYTPQWVQNENFAFCPGTFLYLEEEILFYYILQHQYKTIYSPDFKVFHLEDVSTNTLFKDKRKKALFQIKQLQESYKVLIKYAKNN